MDLCQILHPWHWLTYGQNATAIAACAAVIAAFAAIVAGRYAVKTYSTSQKQLEAVSRPLIAIKTDYAGDVIFSSEGSGPAMNVRWTDEHGKPQYRGAIRVADTATICTMPQIIHAKRVEVTYESLSGKKYKSVGIYHRQTTNSDGYIELIVEEVSSRVPG
jgi:hypothetical protein